MEGIGVCVPHGAEDVAGSHNESHIKMFRANLVILSVANRIANELALGTSVVSRVRLRGVVVPSPEHRIRVTNP